ncbi:unnamed protein product [Heligmosomoides polygyrus]|uniref:CCHC-type domain-containing protein n=1 Tax=Heligmosomoides polygyrus TaxID=6339 RepID=A0A183FQ88_HELPZ|nr:unnamed protein product [Heligmosomoides polygyrus]
MSKDADMSDVDLEEEFRKLCGGHPEPEILQVCNRLERAIKDMGVLVTAEVARAIRVGHPSRAAVEQVGREAAEEAIGVLRSLRNKCRESAIIQRWVEVVLQSLESESRTEGVETMAGLLEMRDEMRRLSETYGVAVANFFQKFEETLAENGALQETVRCQRSELEELREAKRQLEQREVELQQLRAAMDTQGAPRIVGTEAKNSGKYRRGADMLKILRSESKATDETKAFQGSHREELRATALRDGQRRTQLGHGAGRRTLGESDHNSESDMEGSASEMSRSDQVTQYLRYLALPKVRPYSGEDATYSFNAFLENFLLKYPKSGWGEAELGVLLRSKLVGKAKTQYEALPRAIREGSFKEQVDALRQACTAELRNHRIVALGELRKLRKKEGQSVADFCVKLEQLIRRAHPHMSEAALDAERAHLLYEQLAHWDDSYHLMEALESENQPYEVLKQTAMRIERRNWTLRNRAVVPRRSC